MKKRVEETAKLFLSSFALIALLCSMAHGVAAVEVGEVAPDFELPSTTGKIISLRQFRGKKSVLLEFYVADLGAT